MEKPEGKSKIEEQREEGKEDLDESNGRLSKLNEEGTNNRRKGLVSRVVKGNGRK